jgi:UDP-glucose 6-dehydrogenase
MDIEEQLQEYALQNSGHKVIFLNISKTNLEKYGKRKTPVFKPGLDDLLMNVFHKVPVTDEYSRGNS